MPLWMYYIYFFAFLAFGFFVIVPKQYYKKFLLYGLILGAGWQVVIGSSFILFGFIKYKNFGPFGIENGISFWTPITWMFAMGIYLYLLPVRKEFFIPYFILWILLNFVVGRALTNLELFEATGIFKYGMIVNFAIWYSFAAWVFRKYEQRLKI